MSGSLFLTAMVYYKLVIDISEEHQIVLLKNSNITDAVVIWSHEALGHGGSGVTLNNMGKNGI